VGFPFALFFAWAFELTPEGLKREREVDRSQSISHVTGRKLDFAIIGILLLALGYFAYDKFALDDAVESEAEVVQAVPVQDQPASIAVLPFLNLSSDPEQEYFSQGLSEELLNLLAKIPELKVASRTSSFQFQGEKIDLGEVAQKLNVSHVLEGSVRRSGSQLRITAQLIKADDGYHLWSETYDRSMENIFAIQDDISAAVVDALRIELLGEAPKSEVVDPEAYALWLKGRYLYAKWGKDNFEAAIEALKQALEIDPNYARAWASLSVAYLSQTQSGYLSSEEGLALARDAIDKALAIDPGMPEVLARLSLIQSNWEWNWAGAYESLSRALRLSPTNQYVLGATGFFYGRIGLVDKSLAIYRTVLEAEPLDLVSLYNVADCLRLLGRLEEAEQAFRYVLEINPEDWGSHTGLALVMLAQGRPEEAWAELALEVDPQQQAWGRVLALHSLGRIEESDRALQAFIEAHQSWASFHIAMAYAWRGDHEQAFEWLTHVVDTHDPQAGMIGTELLFEPLHDDPRWDALQARMDLPFELPGAVE
jgi:TolB-like protein/Flp pilus assembly protein TadD